MTPVLLKSARLVLVSNVRWELLDAASLEVVGEGRAHNLIVDAGLALISGRVANYNALAAPSYLALGTGNTAPAAGNTTLVAEGARKGLVTAIAAAAQAEFTASFGTGEANGTWAEAGLFGGAATASANSGTLVGRVLFAITKTSSQILKVIWTLTFANAS